MNDTGEELTRGRRLKGWREIAAYFNRTQSTVKRWSAERDLPVYRLAGEQARRGVPVYAYTRELEAWLQTGYGAGDVDERDAVALRRDGRENATVRRPWGLVGVLVSVLAIGLGIVTWLDHDASAPDAIARVAEVPEEAHELYLRGTYLWNRRNPEGIAGAIEALGQAIEIYPDYAEAHAGLAMTYNLARQYSGMSGFDAYPKAEHYARRAVELDPGSGFAQSVLAFVEFHWLWNVEAGLARFEEALRLDPQSSNTLLWYASALILATRPDEALPIINRAQAFDPDSSSIFAMKAQALFYSGSPEEAFELLGEIIARDPSYAWSHYAMYFFSAARGDYPAYLEHYAKLGDMIGVPRYRVAAEAGAVALAEGGVEAMAAAMIAVETEYFERGEALAWDVARHHAMVGDAESAVRWLRVSLDRREERLIGILVDTAFWPIRDRPAFQQLAADVGLPVAL